MNNDDDKQHTHICILIYIYIYTNIHTYICIHTYINIDECIFAKAAYPYVIVLQFQYKQVCVNKRYLFSINLVKRENKEKKELE